MFPVYAFPSAFAMSVIVALALTSLFYAPRNRLSSAFAMFCMAWGLVAAVTLVLQMTGSTAAARLAPPAVWLTYVFMAIYILVLVRRDQQLRTPVHGMRPDVWVGALLVCAMVIGAIAASTPYVVAGVTKEGMWGYGLEFHPAAMLFHLPFAALALYGLSLLYKAWQAEASPARRVFLRNNLAALVAIIASASTFAAVLPSLGLPTFALVFDAFTLIAFYFFGVIANYQYRRVEELNASLEDKVALRTRALEQAQARLVQAEKMVALGRLVAGVAHEINSPLGAVRSVLDTRGRATEALLDGARSGGVAEDRYQRLERALRDGDRVVTDGLGRIDGVVKRLKRFATLDESELQTIDLNRSLEDILALLRPDLEGATLERRLESTRLITCRARAVNQALLNVLTNAAQAVDHHGRVSVQTENDGDGVAIRILDDGPGIAAEHLPHVFDPGFTTRGVGVGTGMGLAIAYRIVNDHGGTIRIDSTLGRGTNVQVHLPERGLDQASSIDRMVDP